MFAVSRSQNRFLKNAKSHTDDDNYHCHHVKRDSELSAICSLHGLYVKERMNFRTTGYASDEFCDQSTAQVGPAARCDRPLSEQ